MNEDILDRVGFRRAPDAERAQRVLARMMLAALLSFTIFILAVL